MTWWLRSRRAATLAGALLVQLALVLLVGGELVPAPSLVAGAITDVPATVFIPLVLNSAVQFSLDVDGSYERAAVRPVVSFDLALIVSACLSLLVVSAVLDAAASENALEAARNALAYVGVGLLVGALADRRSASALPAVCVVLLATLGSDTGGEPSFLQWPLADSSATGAATWAACLWLGGLLAFAFRPYRADRE